MKRSYIKLTEDQKSKIREDWKTLPYGKRMEYAKKVSAEFGCSRHWVKKIGVRDLVVPVANTLQTEAR